MHEKVKALYKSFRELDLLVSKMGATVLELVRHPDAQAEDLLNAQAVYRKEYALLEKNRVQVADALRKKGYSMLSDCVLTGRR